MQTLAIGNMPVRMSVQKVPNLPEHTLLTVVYFGVTVPYAEVFVVGKLGNYRSIGTSSKLGKVDSAGAIPFEDGTVRLFVSEADPNSSGTTSKIRFYDFPNSIPVYKEP